MRTQKPRRPPTRDRLMTALAVNEPRQKRDWVCSVADGDNNGDNDWRLDSAKRSPRASPEMTRNKYNNVYVL